MHELLAPAGSFAALEAAITAGADAVYLGGSRHNARLYGENFTDERLLEAVRYCHLRHRKLYLTLNTLLSDRELSEMPDYAHFLAESGIDGVIVQDIGLATLLHNTVPDLPLHASTQMTVHNMYGIRKAEELGFSRVVLAREAFDRDLIRNSPLEIEVFMHGALCISYSGQCYFSSLIAQRSGNRGTCAQPCRHRYQNGYAMSLHDLCLASHVPALLDLPIASLKIEGRLKSPEYVGGVVSLYRQLLDEKRAATKEEMRFLERLFSRQGFTDAYFLGKKGRQMFGYRTEKDKEASRNVTISLPEAPKIPLSMELSIKKDVPACLTLSDSVRLVRVTGETPAMASTRPLSEEDCQKALGKLGGTPFTANIKAEVEPGLFLSAASLNSLRRDGIRALEDAGIKKRAFFPYAPAVETKPPEKLHLVCMFQSPAQIPDSLHADFVWLPLFAMQDIQSDGMGAILPTIIFDTELVPVKQQLRALFNKGLRHVMCHTIGQAALAKEMGFTPHGGTGMHIYNGLTASRADMASLMASPELTVAQLREMPKPLPLGISVYGRQTLMTMENCLADVHDTCHGGKSYYKLTDEKGNVFPVLCAYPHRNEVLNAHPLYMLDKLDKLKSLGLSTFVLRFTTESKQEISEILRLYETESPAPFPFTRGAFFRKETESNTRPPRRS